MSSFWRRTVRLPSATGTCSCTPNTGIVDGLDCILASENWKNSGIPPDPSFGNRGWGIVARSRGLASYLGAVFENDTNPVQRDLFAYSASDPVYGPPPPSFAGNATVPSGSFSPRSAAAVFQGAIRVSPSFRQTPPRFHMGPLLAMIGSARETLYMEQMACDIEWNRGGNASSNAYLSAVVDAARRGVKVRVLLDGTYLDPSEPAQDNSGAITYLEYIAVKEGLDIQARIARIPGTLKLHNKGAVADGDMVLVSTINWVASSVFDNREVGIVIEGEGPAGYFQDVFMRDWETSTANGTSGKGAGRGIDIDAARTAAICLPAVIGGLGGTAGPVAWKGTAGARRLAVLECWKTEWIGQTPMTSLNMSSARAKGPESSARRRAGP